jgi:hypothetical protein
MKPGFDNPQVGALLKPRHWVSCGAHSVYHALLCLGIVREKEKVVDLRALNPIKRGGPGLLLEDLKKLAEKHGAKPVDLSSPVGKVGMRQLQKKINRHLDLGHPVVLGVDDDEHWVVIAGRNGNNYHWIDSAGDIVAGESEWNEVVTWVGDPNDDPDHYVAMAVAPIKGGTNRSLVPWMGSLWEVLANDPDLAGYWGFYLEQLDHLLDYGPRGASVPASDFFHIHEEAIVQPVLWSDTGGSLKEDDVRGLYRSYWTVADMHSLRVPHAYQSHVACHLALLIREDAAD